MSKTQTKTSKNIKKKGLSQTQYAQYDLKKRDEMQKCPLALGHIMVIFIFIIQHHPETGQKSHVYLFTSFYLIHGILSAFPEKIIPEQHNAR